MSKFYVTTFCNFAHNLKTGRPIKHECFIIPPKLLKIEMEQENFEIVKQEWKHWQELGDARKLVKGR